MGDVTPIRRDEPRLVTADELPVLDHYEGRSYATVDEFYADTRPGWVKVPEDDLAYRVGARWLVRAMSGAATGRVGEHHTVTEHDDGTITIEPSLITWNGWHGFLRHGMFEVLDWGNAA